MDIDYFENIDSEKKAYFLGFILADGCVYKKSNRISFCIHSKDDYILHELKKDIDSKNQIRVYPFINSVSKTLSSRTMFAFSSAKMKSDLLKHGIGENKSSYFEYLNSFSEKYFRHFLRGVFDGDGYVSKIPKSAVSIISTAEFLNFINSYLLNSECIVQNKQPGKNVYVLFIQKYKTVVKFLEYLYKDATIFLKRKHQRYLELKQNNEEVFNLTREVELIIKNMVT